MRMTVSEYESFLARRAASRSSLPSLPTGTHDAARESDARAAVVRYCESQGWAVFQGNPTRPSGRTLGEPDLTIAADGGRTFWVEMKSRTGKPRPEQLAKGAMLKKLGHRFMFARSLKDFIDQILIND